MSTHKYDYLDIFSIKDKVPTICCLCSYLAFFCQGLFVMLTFCLLLVTLHGYSATVGANQEYDRILHKHLSANTAYLSRLSPRARLHANYTGQQKSSLIQLSPKTTHHNDFSSSYFSAPLFQDAESILAAKDVLDQLMIKTHEQSLSPWDYSNLGLVSLSIKSSLPFSTNMALPLTKLVPHLLKGITCHSPPQCLSMCSLFYQSTSVQYQQLQSDLLCFSVHVLQEVCLSIQKEPNEVVLTGPGCFSQGQVGRYVPYKDREDPENIQIKVLDINDPYIWQTQHNFYGHNLPLIISLRQTAGIIGLLFLLLTWLLFSIFYCYSHRKQKIVHDDTIKMKAEQQLDIDLDTSLASNRAPDWNDLESSIIR